jgi:hypothetical protein
VLAVADADDDDVLELPLNGHPSEGRDRNREREVAVQQVKHRVAGTVRRIVARRERHVEAVRPPVHGRHQVVLLRPGQGDGHRLAGPGRRLQPGLRVAPAPHGEDHRDQRRPRRLEEAAPAHGGRDHHPAVTRWPA